MNPNRAPLAVTNPFPETIEARLRQQLTFLVEVDRLKTVLRQSPLAAADRRENDAEHSWHLAMLVVVLAEYADEAIDIKRTLELVLLHDLVEIYAGDTPLYDAELGAGQADRESVAADVLSRCSLRTRPSGSGRCGTSSRPGTLRRPDSPRRWTASSH